MEPAQPAALLPGTQFRSKTTQRLPSSKRKAEHGEFSFLWSSHKTNGRLNVRSDRKYFYISPMRKPRQLTGMLCRVCHDQVRQVRQPGDDPLIEPIDPKMVAVCGKLAGHFVEEDQQSPAGKTPFPTLEHR